MRPVRKSSSRNADASALRAAPPFYQFTVPVGSATARKKAEVAAAVTAVHAQITGAPREYVNCSFVEVPPGSIFTGGGTVEGGRMVGVIRRGRSEEVKRKLVMALRRRAGQVRSGLAGG